MVQALDALAEGGPGLGRPLVDTIHGSSMAHLKELRPGTVRILFAFDPWRSSNLLVAGDKSGRWNEWYRDAISMAEQRYETYVKERAREEGGRPRAATPVGRTSVPSTSPVPAVRRPCEKARRNSSRR